MMKACRRLSTCGAGQDHALGSGRLATAQHLCGALVGLVNPGLVGISLGEGKGEEEGREGYQFACIGYSCCKLTRLWLRNFF